MATTIQISQQLLGVLKQRKLYDRESYEEVIWDIVEDSQELNKETKELIAKAHMDVKKGKTYTHKQVKNILGL